MLTHTQDLTHTGQPKLQRYKWTVQDKPGRFMLIDKNRLKVDHEYQRDELAQSKVLNIAGEWSWIAAGVIIVAHRKGEFYVMDGQYRTLASLKRTDIVQLPCMVFDVDGIEQEARGFLATNKNRKPISSLDAFKALLVTGDATAMRADALVRQVGRRPGRRSSSTVECITVLMKLIRQCPDQLDRMWPIIAAVCEGKPLHERLLDGFVLLESRLPDGESLSDARWRRRIMQVGYDSLLEEIVKTTAYYAKGGAKIWALGIQKAINHRLRIPLAAMD